MLRASVCAKTIAMLLAVISVGACVSSPKIEFFALEAMPVQKAPAPVAAAAHVQITVVHIPAVLDRQQMVRVNGTMLTVSDQHRWAAPLAEMIRRVLTQELAARTPAGVVVLPEEPAPNATAQIVVDLLQFDANATGTVVLDGSWSLTQAGAQSPRVREPIHYVERSGAVDYAGQVHVMSEILAHLASDMAETLARAHTGEKAR